MYRKSIPSGRDGKIQGEERQCKREQKRSLLRICRVQPVFSKEKVRKGVWRMPRLMEAKKDVISCDKPRVGANDL